MDITGIWHYIKISATYIVPWIALVFSIISWCRTKKFRKMQHLVNEIDLKIKKNEFAKLEEMKAKASLACIEASVVHISNYKYKLKIWNSGQARAYKVKASIEEDANLIIKDSKMPFDFLDAGQSFEEGLIVHDRTQSKFMITTAWEDADGQSHQKEQMGSL